MSNKAGRKAKRVRRALAWLALWGAGAALAFGWLAPDVAAQTQHGSAVNWLVFMIRTFTFHAGLGVVVVGLYAAVFRLRGPLIAAGVLAIATLWPTAWSWRPRSAPVGGGESLSVMSMNVLFSNPDTARVVGAVRAADPDVLVMQEYTPAHDAALSAALGGAYPYRATAYRDDAFGMAVYSKRAFVGAPVLYPPAELGGGWRRGGVVNLSDPQVRVVVEAGGREVVIQGVHAMPPGTPGMLEEQRRMVRWLADWGATESRPVLLMGDFNATASAPTEAWLEGAGFADAWKAVGRGRGSTWPAVGALSWLPGVAIDHVYAKGLGQFEEARVGPGTGSDHWPLIVRVRIPGESATPGGGTR